MRPTVATQVYEDGMIDIQTHLNVARVIRTMKRVDAICKVLFTRPQVKMLQFSRKSVLPKLPKDTETDVPLDWVDTRFRRIIMQEKPNPPDREVSGRERLQNFTRNGVEEDQIEFKPVRKGGKRRQQNEDRWN